MSENSKHSFKASLKWWLQELHIFYLRMSVSLPDCGAHMASGMAGPPRSVCRWWHLLETSTSGMCARSTLNETGHVEIEFREMDDAMTLGCWFVEAENMLRGRHSFFLSFWQIKCMVGGEGCCHHWEESIWSQKSSWVQRRCSCIWTVPGIRPQLLVLPPLMASKQIGILE